MNQENKSLEKFVGLRPKAYSYFKDNKGECKKAEGTKKVCWKKKA